MLVAEYGPAHASRLRRRTTRKKRPNPSRFPTSVRSSSGACRRPRGWAAAPFNPLALEEFSAQEERHRFLTEQLEDLKRTRRDLLDIVREVDERVHQVFTEAYLDGGRAFAEIFASSRRDGRLVLTDPDDMLATGLDVEAPPRESG